MLTAMRQIDMVAMISAQATNRMEAAATAAKNGATRLGGCEHFSKAIRAAVREEQHATVAQPDRYSVINQSIGVSAIIAGWEGIKKMGGE